jgi:hypothetical protein
MSGSGPVGGESSQIYCRPRARVVTSLLRSRVATLSAELISTGGERLTRASWIRAALAAAFAALAVHACRDAGDAGSERAWSVQLHVHGSFSEGEGSIDSHSWEARDVGCDVVWWSDHDFRLTTYQHVTRFGFEGPFEPLGRNESWAPRLKRNVQGKKLLEVITRPAAAEMRFERAPVTEGEHSLFLAALGKENAFETQLLCLSAERFLVRRSLASGVTLRLAVQPESYGPDARILVEAQLSEHAPRDGLGIVPVFVRYLLGEEGPPRREGQVYLVPVAVQAGRWNELALPLTADAVRGFPASPGEDNALYRLAFGVQARRGARAAAYLDDLRIEQERAGPVMYEREGELIREVGALYPGLGQLQGVEISYGSRHLNVFCEEPVLPDYDAIADEIAAARAGDEAFDERGFRAAVIRRAVDDVHRLGGLVSYNHPFGTTFEENEKPRTNEEQLRILMRNKAEGADILEVGYRDRGGAKLDDHLWLWDQAALAGLRLVGTGVSDSHGGAENRWRGTPNNFVSWIWAEKPDKKHLIEGLRRGRVFFGDLERFDGELDLVTEAGERMGATAYPAESRVRVELIARGLKVGQQIVVVESGQRTSTYPAEGPEFRRWHDHELPALGRSLVRFEVHDASGPIALSNPIHFLGGGER